MRPFTSLTALLAALGTVAPYQRLYVIVDVIPDLTHNFGGLSPGVGYLPLYRSEARHKGTRLSASHRNQHGAGLRQLRSESLRFG